MYESYIVLRGISLGLLLALSLVALLSYWQLYAVRVMVCFALGVSGYLLAPLLYGKSNLFHLSTALADTVPLLFLLFTQAVFDEHTRPARSSLIAGVAYLAAGYAASYLPAFVSTPEAWLTVLRGGSRMIMVALLCYTLYLILRYRREDLVEPRRLLRLTVIVIIGGYILAVVGVETLIAAPFPLWMELAHSIGITLSTLAFVSVLVYLGPHALGSMASATTPGTTPQASPLAGPDQLEVARIVSAMEAEHLYRDMELTIRSLGVTLSIPEHRLRQHINQQLAYRNFNDFLNRYRIEEAASRLTESEHARTPILTIAMDAGYRSMTTFNKAFKALHGQTPKEYRQKHLPIS
jgi:AraC-like DNA-binding protein